MSDREAEFRHIPVGMAFWISEGLRRHSPTLVKISDDQAAELRGADEWRIGKMPPAVLRDMDPATVIHAIGIEVY